MGTLIDEKVDLRDISATIIDLAVRRYLKIEEQGTSSWFSSGSDYRFIKLKGPQGLKNFELRLYNQIFSGGDDVCLSDLQEKFFPVLAQVRDDLYGGLSKERYFDGNPETIRGTFLVVGIMLVLGVMAAACVIQFAMIGRIFFLPVIIAGVVSVLAVVVTSRIMPRKTRKGRVAWEKIAGLQEYIRRAEVDDIQEQERQGLFERLLPYAIIFGLSKRWGKAFENLYREPPDWYQPARPMDFSTWMLINNIDRSMWMMNQTFPTSAARRGRYRQRPRRRLRLVEWWLQRRRVQRRRLRWRRGKLVVRHPRRFKQSACCRCQRHGRQYGKWQMANGKWHRADDRHSRNALSLPFVMFYLPWWTRSLEVRLP